MTTGTSDVSGITGGPNDEPPAPFSRPQTEPTMPIYEPHALQPFGAGPPPPEPPSKKYTNISQTLSCISLGLTFFGLSIWVITAFALALSLPFAIASFPFALKARSRNELHGGTLGLSIAALVCVLIVPTIVLIVVAIDSLKG